MWASEWLQRLPLDKEVWLSLVLRSLADDRSVRRESQCRLVRNGGIAAMRNSTASRQTATAILQPVNV